MQEMTMDEAASSLRTLLLRKGEISHVVASSKARDYGHRLLVTIPGHRFVNMSIKEALHYLQHRMVL